MISFVGGFLNALRQLVNQEWCSACETECQFKKCLFIQSFCTQTAHILEQQTSCLVLHLLANFQLKANGWPLLLLPYSLHSVFALFTNHRLKGPCVPVSGSYSSIPLNSIFRTCVWEYFRLLLIAVGISAPGVFYSHKPNTGGKSRTATALPFSRTKILEITKPWRILTWI